MPSLIKLLNNLPLLLTRKSQSPKQAKLCNRGLLCEKVRYRFLVAMAAIYKQCMIIALKKRGERKGGKSIAQRLLFGKSRLSS